MLDAATAQAFLDAKTVATFGGATTAIFAVTATIRRLLKIESLFVPFGLSLLLSFALSFGVAQHALDWLIAFFNACLLFLAVVGANETATNAANPQPAPSERAAARPKFLQSFFQPRQLRTE